MGAGGGIGVFFVRMESLGVPSGRNFGLQEGEGMGESGERSSMLGSGASKLRRQDWKPFTAFSYLEHKHMKIRSSSIPTTEIVRAGG